MQNERMQEHISEAAVAQLGEQRTLRLHSFTCRSFDRSPEGGEDPDARRDEDPQRPSDTSKDLTDHIQDAMARARAQVRFLCPDVI